MTERLGGGPMTRTPRELTRAVLDDAIAQGVVVSYTIRDRAGRATVHWPGGTKSYPSNILDVLAHLRAHGYQDSRG